ncbi:uncharacterized protein STEHIDRAFT_150528 [Stereum hirsutum FP-91666 SS1]|uniref:Uncharacterized protein n=1 Tax=Stereum hirsutum (strain FP-91666) TaxID=721885 RepID=R7RZK3_STEHR|nr:uncharacterized protein STEHIDRAFT_150528 [Stereum hirsutum FP-91666 SS1]EIM80268.1 hypothetical protein STEHIDRAFT_150528 [Stereum hirsutum FP-91666 SS1]
MTGINRDGIKALLECNNAEGTNTWVWSEENKKQWDHVDGGYGKSCAHWYNRSFDFDQDTPYPIDLGLAGTSGDKPAIYLYPSSTGSRGSEILVTEEYNKMYYRILERATNPYRRGVLITGEPGIENCICICSC